jgi:hypothetical protein
MRSAGLLVLDPGLLVLDSNQKICSMLNERILPPGSRFTSLLNEADAQVLSQAAAQLKRPAAGLRRFVLGLRAGCDGGFPAEVVWCPAPRFVQRDTSAAGSPFAPPPAVAAGAGGELREVGFFVLFASPALPVGEACVLRTVLSVLGFRPGETRAVFRPRRSPAAPTGPTPDAVGTRRSGGAGGGGGGGAGPVMDVLPAYAAASAREFLMRGLRDGDWGGAEEWLAARPAYPARDRLLSTVRALAAPAGGGGDAGRGLTLEFGLEGAEGAEGRVLRARVVMRGVCLVEMLMAGGAAASIRHTLSLPAHSQRWVDGGGAAGDQHDLEAAGEKELRVRPGRPGGARLRGGWAGVGGEEGTSAGVGWGGGRQGVWRRRR